MKYIIIGEEENQQCYVLKNLLFSKQIDYQYVDKSKIDNETLNFFKQSDSTYPIVVSVEIHEFDSFQQKLSYFRNLSE